MTGRGSPEVPGYQRVHSSCLSLPKGRRRGSPWEPCDRPILQLFTTCVARLVSVPQRGVGIEVTAYEGQVALLHASIIYRVRDASRSDGGRVDVVDCGPFPAGELNLDCEAF